MKARQRDIAGMYRSLHQYRRIRVTYVYGIYAYKLHMHIRTFTLLLMLFRKCCSAEAKHESVIENSASRLSERHHKQLWGLHGKHGRLTAWSEKYGLHIPQQPAVSSSELNQTKIHFDDAMGA